MSPKQPHARKPRRAWLRQAAVAILITVLVAFGMASASAYALPGDVLYPVKTLLEDFQRVVTMDEVSEARLHLRFAANRLEEVAALLAQERFSDIPTAMMDFEVEMREAVWALAEVTGDEQSHFMALGSILGEDLDNRTQVLNNLLNKAPDEAQSAIDQAVGILLEESKALRALIQDAAPEVISVELGVEGSTEVRSDIKTGEQDLTQNQSTPSAGAGEVDLQPRVEEKDPIAKENDPASAGTIITSGDPLESPNVSATQNSIPRKTATPNRDSSLAPTRTPTPTFPSSSGQ